MNNFTYCNRSSAINSNVCQLNVLFAVQRLGILQCPWKIGTEFIFKIGKSRTSKCSFWFCAWNGSINKISNSLNESWTTTSRNGHAHTKSTELRHDQPNNYLRFSFSNRKKIEKHWKMTTKWKRERKCYYILVFVCCDQYATIIETLGFWDSFAWKKVENKSFLHSKE